MTSRKQPLPSWLEAFVKGTDEERVSMLREFRSMPAVGQQALAADLRTVLDGGDGLSMSWPRQKDERSALRGWLIAALANLDGHEGLADTRFVRYVDPRQEPSEWVRYWTLANLYWVAPASRPLVAAEAVDDASDLVRALARALHHGPDLRPLTGGDSRSVWACLRALQVVADPDAVPAVVELLTRKQPDYIVYDALMALTVSPIIGDLASIAFRNALSDDEFTRVLLKGSVGASLARVQRFARLLHRPLTALQEAARSPNADFAAAAKGLLTGLSESAARRQHVAPSGEQRMELGYRIALARPRQFEVLESLSSAQLASCLDDIDPGGRGSDQDTALSRLRERAPGGPPNPLWMAWIKNIHAGKLTQD